MTKPKKLSLTRSTLVPVITEPTKMNQDQGRKPRVWSTSNCPWICE